MKSRFKQPLIELLTLSLIVGFLLVNIVRILSSLNFMQLLPIAIQSAILALYFTKHKYLSIGLKIWSVLFILGSGLTVVAFALGGFAEMPSSKLIWVAIDFIVGVLLWLIASSEIELVVKNDLTEIE